MKKFLILTTMFVALAAVSFGQQVALTAHDFSAAAWNPGPAATEICAPCHQPHGGTTTAATQVLFSQTLSVAAFTVYDSPTLAGTADASGSSLLCLSCHDDATSIHGGGTIETGLGYAASNNLGTNLNSSHPIGVASIVAGDFKAPTNARYIGGNVECASCHDPHDNSVVDGNFLITTNASSALCLDCHIK